MNIKHTIVILFFTVLAVTAGQAATNTVEIFYLPHRPAMAVVRDVEDVLKKYSNIKVKKYSFEDPAAGELLEKYHIKNHMPVAIFINGKHEFSIGSRKIVFENFPKGNAFVPSFEGNWSYDDLVTVLKTLPGIN